MRAKSAKVHDDLKTAILRHYNMTGKMYHQRFRATMLNAVENPWELVACLGDLSERWMKNCTTVKDTIDLIFLEELLDTLTEQVHLWVCEGKPRMSEEANQCADITAGEPWTTATQKVPEVW